jgi:subtilisin-like proprotein convertase family protein
MRIPPFCLAILLATFAAPHAGAVSFVSSPGAALADNAGDTTPVTDGIDTSGTFFGGELVTSVTIDLQMDHTWVGDLAIELTSPSGTELQILARPGDSHADETTGGPFGDNSNLVSTATISFLDGAATSAELLGAGAGANIPAGSYFPDADAWLSDISNFAGFNGESAGGTWTLRVGDYALGDVGTLVSWTLHIEAAVPEAGQGLMMMAGLLGLLLAGRERQS